jgi:mRNA interferase MazF
MAYAGGVDWLLCQVTSNPYGDPAAIALTGNSFASGGLNRDSFARPGKLFTASASIVIREAGVLRPVAHRTIVQSVIDLLQSGLQ